MYTGHFGLDDGPFHGKAEGEDVYVGPQQATVVSRLRKALGTGDTVVAVSGPVGVGKTTLVRRAIADIPGRKVVIPVDRIRLEPDEVLDLLLTRFEVSRQPKGTIQRVAAFRRLLQERLSDDVRVFIVVEDAERVGIDALLELEALTATDGGEPFGANIVLMGDSDLPALLCKSALARLRQRIRLRQVVAPFDTAEVEGYMRHCLDAAGGVFEQIFEPGTTRIVHAYSGGIARVVDNLCESALVAAAEAGLATILPEFLQEVAENCGLEPQVAEPDAIGEAPETTPATDETVDDARANKSPAHGKEPAVAPAATPKLALVEKPPVPAEDVRPDDVPQPQPDTPVHDSSSPVNAVADEESEDAPALPSAEDEWKLRSASLAASRIDEVLPELIEQFQSSAGGPGRPASAFAPSAVPHADDHDIPTLSSSMRIAVLPVRRLDERPLTAESDGDDEVPENDGSEPALDTGTGIDEPEPLAGIAHEPAIEAPLLQQNEEVAASDESEPPNAEIAEVEPIEDAAPEIEPPPEIARLPEQSQEQSQEQSREQPAEIPSQEQPEEQPEDAAGEEQPAAGSVHFEVAPVFDESFSLGTVIAAESEEDQTTEASALSVEEELTLAPDAVTDVFVAENDAGDEEPALDALQAAIQAANAWQASDATSAVEEQAAAPSGGADAELPEITLDAELEKQKPSPTEQLDQWAEELSKARSLEDISDILAETIFGNEEIEAISAEIRAKKAAEKAASEPAAPPPKAAPARPAAAASQPKPRPANAAPARSVAGPRPVSPARPAAGSGLNMTLSQRIEMVNSLKGKKTLKPLAGMPIAEIVLAEQPDEPLPKVAANAPAPIEAQIDTAITQSRKVLSKADLARLTSSVDNDGDDDDKKGSRGLFGFFRRS